MRVSMRVSVRVSVRVCVSHGVKALRYNPAPRVALPHFLRHLAVGRALT
jgi:hypothetical protein